ncbi:MAG: FkbM family methyltransferase [Flammeovirgaceae bacterium]|nr:FkbM family methyltransferase [Flammeovirgaceae bacterium]
MLTALYRSIIPSAVRGFVYDLFLGRVLFFIRHFRVIVRSKLTFAFSFLLPKTEKNRVFSFMGKHGLTSYPYEYSLAYKSLEIQVEKDDHQNLLFVYHHGRRLYFPEFYSVEMVKKDYRALITEQDSHSAHRYVRSYNDLKDRTLLDVGAAEGIFSLDTIELTKRVIIFECLDHWQKPLMATFANWTNKVSFIKKYVGNQSAGDLITIDEFLSAESKDNLFIKMDIEGAERSALEGAKATLATGRNIQLAICTYHRQGDPEFMADLLTGYGYSIEFSNGFMYWNKRISKGIIRGKN